MSSFIISVTAADRVGIVYSVTGALLDLGGNVLELSQTVMRGYFTIILEAEFASSPATRQQIVDAIHERGRRFDLQVQVTEIKDGAEPVQVPSGERFILTVLGDDSPGIVHGIAGSLAAHGANIVDLHARVDGERFSLVMEALIPHDLTPAAIRSELERYGRAHKLEAFVQHENIFAATTEPSPVRIGAALRGQGDSVASN
ncbi:ACT domain-containing protein [Paludisphaera sp.]|uniref:glycine cleavage system protein R n=1 Tax=Paludisphaera sp. TaxID=2017432 RepID=UPI00301C6058